MSPWIPVDRVAGSGDRNARVGACGSDRSLLGPGVAAAAAGNHHADHRMAAALQHAPESDIGRDVFAT